MSFLVEENTNNRRNPPSSNYYNNHCSNSNSNSYTISKPIVTVTAIVTNKTVTVSNSNGKNVTIDT